MVCSFGGNPMTQFPNWISRWRIPRPCMNSNLANYPTEVGNLFFSPKKGERRTPPADSRLAFLCTARFSDPSCSCWISKTTSVDSNPTGPTRGNPMILLRLMPIKLAFRDRLVKSGKKTVRIGWLDRIRPFVVFLKQRSVVAWYAH